MDACHPLEQPARPAAGEHPVHQLRKQAAQFSHACDIFQQAGPERQPVTFDKTCFSLDNRCPDVRAAAERAIVAKIHEFTQVVRRQGLSLFPGLIMQPIERVKEKALGCHHMPALLAVRAGLDNFADFIFR